MEEKMRIHIYGDSLMKGTVIDENMRYHATISEDIARFQDLFGMEIKNASRFGSTIERGQKTLDRDLREGSLCDIALVEFGGNDCSFRWNEVSATPEGEHEPLTPIDRFVDIYRAMLLALKERGIRPILMTLPPIDSERYLDFISRGNSKANILQWLGDVHMIYRFHELYSRAVERLAKETNTLLIDVRASFLGRRNFRELVGLDGIHLNPQGYRVLIESIQEFVAARLPGLQPA